MLKNTKDCFALEISGIKKNSLIINARLNNCMPLRVSLILKIEPTSCSGTPGSDMVDAER